MWQRCLFSVSEIGCQARRRGREKETDILITSLALRKPGTQREITVIITDQHVCFLRIDALRGAGNHTCADNI